MWPTTTSEGVSTLIFQTGQGFPAPGLRPTVYKFPELSPVNPSMANGVVISVVNVAFAGQGKNPTSGLRDSPVPFQSLMTTLHTSRLLLLVLLAAVTALFALALRAED